MSIFDLKQKTITPPGFPDDKIVIRELTYGEATRIATGAFSDLSFGEVEDKEKIGKIRVNQLDMRRPKFETMKACIVSWTFKRNGKVAPINMENIEALPATIGDFIMEEIDALNPEPDNKFQGEARDILPDGKGEVTE